MRNSNGELILCNSTRVKSFLSDILKNPDEQGIIISRLTLKNKFILRIVIRDNGKGTVSNSLLLDTVLLVNEMLIWSENDSLIAGIMFAEDFINDRNKKLNAVIHKRPKGIIVGGRCVFVRIVVRAVHLPKEIEIYYTLEQ